MSIIIEHYIAELSEANPCGDDLQYDAAFVALEQAIKGKPEQQMGSAIQDAEAPNWFEIKKTAQDLLGQTRDLRVLVWLLRALLVTDGFIGLQQGIQLVNELVEQRWPTIHPQLDPDDDNDPTERVNVLMGLCDHEFFLKPLQAVPLLESKLLGKISLRDMQLANANNNANQEPALALSTIEAAIQDCDVTLIQDVFTAVCVSAAQITSLEEFVTDQVGINAAPSFSALQSIFKECKTLLAGWLASKGIAEPESETTGNQDGEVLSSKSAAGSINNTQDVLLALNKICEYYQKHEPSSPVPIMLQRCSRLVGKNFMDVLKDIAPNGLGQAGLIMGIADDNYGN